MKRFLIVLFIVPSFLMSQNKLKKAKQNLGKKATVIKSSSRVRKTNAGKRHGKSSSHNESSFDNLLLEIGFYATLGVVFGEAQERDLNPYPYYYKHEGEYAAELSNTGRKQNLKLGISYLFNRPNGIALNAQFKPIPIIGVDLSYIHFSEKNRTNADVLDITSLMFNYHRFREKNFTLWWGLGMTYVGNDVRKLGFAYNIGTEIYLFEPTSLHFSWKESFINESEIGVFKSKIKYHIENKSLYLGYEIHQIGGENINTPTIGVEIIF